MKKSRQQVRDEVGLDELPDDEFMQLLEEVGEGPTVSGPPTGHLRAHEPEEIAYEIIQGPIGALLGRARAEVGFSLRRTGEGAGVSRGRIQQLEKSDNLEVATLVRVAAALGYRVGISLQPIEAGRQPFFAELDSVHT